MPQNLIEWAGVCGFFLAVLSLVLQAMQYRHEKKTHAEEAEERVDVQLRFQVLANGVSSPLVATVVNTGRARVALDKVEIECGPAEPTAGQSILSIPLTMLGQGIRADPGAGCVLEPGDKREFSVPAEHPVLPRFAAANPSELRLIVYSNRGAIARIGGDRVGPYLRDWPTNASKQ